MVLNVMQGKRCGDRYPVRFEMMEIVKPGSALNGWQVGGAFFSGSALRRCVVIGVHGTTELVAGQRVFD